MGDMIRDTEDGIWEAGGEDLRSRITDYAFRAMSDFAIFTQGLRKTFGNVTAVDGLDLAVRRGEIFGLVGPDGAGKTTTLRLLCGILLPTEGQAKVAGFDVVAAPEEVKARIGYLSQRFSLYGDLTVWENIAFTADLYRVPRRDWEPRAEALLQASRMVPFKRRLADHLSGGMKQKLALTCTLIHAPEVLLLDEPTTGVDPVSRREFWNILYGLPAQGVTIVISTPYMDEAERCMRLAFLQHGQSLACDTPAGLKAMLGGEVLAWVVHPPRAGRDLLRERPDVQQVTLFGNVLHVVVENAARDAPFLRQALREARLKAEEPQVIAPGLEDVFVKLAGSAE